MGERLRAAFTPYPRIRRWIHAAHPDVQGPMDILEMVWGNACFVDLIDQPDGWRCARERGQAVRFRLFRVFCSLSVPV